MWRKESKCIDKPNPALDGEEISQFFLEQEHAHLASSSPPPLPSHTFLDPPHESQQPRTQDRKVVTAAPTTERKKGLAAGGRETSGGPAKCKRRSSPIVLHFSILHTCGGSSLSPAPL